MILPNFFKFLRIAVSPVGQTQSDKLAACLYEAAIKNFPGKHIRTDYSDNDPDWEENFFMDDFSDAQHILSYDGLQSIIDTHIEGITAYINP